MTDYRAAAAHLATRYHIPPGLFSALIQQESSWNPNARSPVGAIGLGQLMPDTARGLNVDPYNALQNLEGAAKYLSGQYGRFHDWRLALAAYNAGPGAVAKYGGIPPYTETQNYVRTILANAGGISSIPSGPMVGAPPPGMAGAPPSLGPMPSLTFSPERSLIDRQALLGALARSSTSGDYTRFYQTLGTQRKSRLAAPGLTLQIPTARAPAVSIATTAAAPGGLGRILGRIIGLPYQGSHTLFGNWESDNAVDVAMPVGSPIYAPVAGVIGSQIGALRSGDPHLQGLRLHLTGGGNELYLAHLSRLIVRAGQRVKAGQLLGYSGSANGVEHLHLGSRHGTPVRYVG